MRWIVLLLAAVLVACPGGNHSVDPGAGKPTVAGFTATPATLPAKGGSVTLSWAAKNATSLALTPGVGDVTGKSSVVVNVSVGTTFTLTAFNSAGTATASTAVSVEAAAKPTVSGFTATPATLPYGGGSVTLSWVATDATSLAISPDVGDVTGKTSAMVNVTTDTAFTLTASNLAGTATATTAVSVATVTSLSGHTVTTLGFPLPNAAVLVVGKPKVTSDGTGAFTVPDVTPPYTAAIVDPATPNIVIAYAGLTSAMPVLGGTSSGTEAIGTISGTTFSGCLPRPASQPVSVSFAYEGRSVSSSVASDGSYSLNVHMPPGKTQVSGQLAALEQCTNPLKCPYPFVSYGEKDNVTVVQATPLTGQNFTLSPVASATVSGTVALPSGHTVNGGLTYMMLPKGHLFSLENFSATPWSFGVPAVTGATFGALVSTKSTTAALLYKAVVGLTAGQMDVTIPIPAAIVSSVPDGTSTHTLSWTGPDLNYRVSLTAGNQTRSVYTNATSLPLPDLTPLGFGWAAGTTYTTQLIGFGPKKTMNEISPKGMTAYYPDLALPAVLEITNSSTFVYAP